MSLLGKPIEEVIETLYKSIKSKRQIITNMKDEYNLDNDSFNDIKINRFKLIDLLDEFEVTISQSLQAIQTFKVEIFNLKEKQATEEILNLTNEFQMKYNQKENLNNSNNNNNILDKLEYSRTENSIIEPKTEKNNNIQNNVINNNNKKENNGMNGNNKIKKEEGSKGDEIKIGLDSIKETKLNFDYSSLLNNSQSSLKTSFSNLDKFRINNDKSDNNQNNKENNLILNSDLGQNNNKISQKENTGIDLINNNINKEDIEEEQPSKLNIDIIRANNEIVNKMKLGGNDESNKDISCFSENRDFINNNSNFEKYNINKYYSMRQSELNINNINNNQNLNYKFNLLNNEINDSSNNNNFDESDLISLVSKNDIIKEKFQKLENNEKINKLIEEIFSIKAFKLYILDKFGDGNSKIFFEKIKNGEINKEELESELNILKEIYNSNNVPNSTNNLFLTETKKQKTNKINKFTNKTLSNINLNMNMNIDSENNLNKNNKYNTYKKINHKSKRTNISLNDNNNKEECKTRNNNFRQKNKIINYSNNNSINKNKNISSHSVSSIRARIKCKKF